MKQIKVDLKDKKCRYCKNQATQAVEVIQHAFPFAGPWHTSIFYLCDSQVWGECCKLTVRGIEKGG